MMVVKSYEELGRSPEAGDRVIISKDATLHRHWAFRMERFIGTVMTVRSFNELSNVVKMEEDVTDYLGNSTSGWDWFLPMIEGVVINCAEEIDEDPSVWTSDFSIEDLLTS